MVFLRQFLANIRWFCVSIQIIQFLQILACVAISVAIHVAIRVGVLNQRNWFGDQRTLLQGIIDALNAVLLHLQQKARRHLRLRCARVEESWCGMCEEFPGHQVIGLHSRCYIAAVDATRCTHDKVLWPLHTLSVHTKEIWFFQGFEAKVVVPEVTWLTVTLTSNSAKEKRDDFRDTTWFSQQEPMGPCSSRDQDGLLVSWS